MKIGYLKNLGRHELEEAVGKWQTLHKNEKVILEPVSYDEVEKKIQNNELDAVLVNSRHTIYRQLVTYPVDDVALEALVQAGNFNKYQQTVEVSDLKNLPCIMVAGVEEEKSEYHYLKDVLQVDSDLLAVESFGEAVLMVESGSGYLIMNEKTAAHIDDDQVQKLFLLREGKQLTEEYAFIAKPEKQQVEELSKILKETIN
ncbi:LysR substrate-binding domain-containing protein [Lactobacillus johnsonii]|uniref:LysR substrate-binding domain-containing protein n=1 Tax=Lactobacillus johnsonii TaxID=33959 RepID=UPI0028E590BA|nr:LysR substrate-binding domain-containing protein [Lactobacillus johnsonii]MDT9606649.1 LysR substrate-binding domain-containing protein [Lactobacillus johnsonii]